MIELKHITKVYDNNYRALDDINLTIRDGEIFGIIGQSGAGKSTLVRCINMLEPPSSGEVIINGKDMTKLSSSELRKERKNIGMIFQHFNLLMQRSVLDNVCFPMEIVGVKKQAARKRAMELLEIVGLKEKADAYPSQLSGGQKQRISIARIFLKNPPILILDEATSALDSVTEAKIQETFEKLAVGRTTIIIAHRLSTVKSADDIVVIEQGQIVEKGSHNELMQKEGVYASLVHTQELKK